MSIDLVLVFMSEQWVLVTALAMTLTLLALHESRKAGPGLSVTEAIQLVNGKNGVFLDIRDRREFDRGHITGAINIPILELQSRISELENFKENPIIVVCKMGQSAGPTTKTLKSEGFQGARKLSGGMMEWDAQKLPVV